MAVRQLRNLFLIFFLLVIIFLILKPILTVKKEKHPKNIIFLVGDGMGFSYITAYRYFKNKPYTLMMKKTEFDRYFAGVQMTYPNDPLENITDSAAAATAMATGVKTYNNAIGVDGQYRPLKNVFEQAKEKGKSTGLVVTSEIAHATPAGFSVHNINRKNMDSIANGFYDERINGKHKVDVLLGGGLKNFIREDRNLVNEFKKDGYSFALNRKMLLKDHNSRILGLFASGGLDKMIDRNKQTPSLVDMINSAIKRLNRNNKGFFLLVEGSQIDWGGHNHDIVSVMSEMQDFEAAFKECIYFAKKDKHTLVIATADHSTGGLSVGVDGSRKFDVTSIKAAKRTPHFIAEKIVKGAHVESILKKYIHISLTEKEKQSVKNAAITMDVNQINDAIKSIFNIRSHTGWTTNSHTGEDVPIYAYGPFKEKFTRLLENIDQAKNILMFSK